MRELRAPGVDGLSIAVVQPDRVTVALCIARPDTDDVCRLAGPDHDQPQRLRRDLAATVRVPADLRLRGAPAIPRLLGVQRHTPAATPAADALGSGRASGHAT